MADPGPPTEITTISRTSSHSGAGPGSASTMPHMTAFEAMIANTIQDRRIG